MCKDGLHVITPFLQVTRHELDSRQTGIDCCHLIVTCARARTHITHTHARTHITHTRTHTHNVVTFVMCAAAWLNACDVTSKFRVRLFCAMLRLHGHNYDDNH
jgi:hypothetical protein